MPWIIAHAKHPKRPTTNRHRHFDPDNQYVGHFRPYSDMECSTRPLAAWSARYFLRAFLQIPERMYIDGGIEAGINCRYFYLLVLNDFPLQLFRFLKLLGLQSLETLFSISCLRKLHGRKIRWLYSRVDRDPTLMSRAVPSMQPSDQPNYYQNRLTFSRAICCLIFSFCSCIWPILCSRSRL